MGQRKQRMRFIWFFFLSFKRTILDVVIRIRYDLKASNLAISEIQYSILNLTTCVKFPVDLFFTKTHMVCRMLFNWLIIWVLIVLLCSFYFMFFFFYLNRAFIWILCVSLALEYCIFFLVKTFNCLSGVILAQFFCHM